MELEISSQVLSVCRLEARAAIPDWALRSPFFSISRTNDELSVVCVQGEVPDGIKTERDWRCFKVKGPLDFGLVGILAGLSRCLAEAGISIFAISTFDTDYVLVKQKDFDRAVEALTRGGNSISNQ